MYLLSMIIFNYIHVAANGIISFFYWLNSISLYICTTLNSSVDGDLGFFHVSAIVSSAAMNIGYMYLFGFSLDICPGVGLLDHTIALFLDF